MVQYLLDGYSLWSTMIQLTPSLTFCTTVLMESISDWVWVGGGQKTFKVIGLLPALNPPLRFPTQAVLTLFCATDIPVYIYIQYKGIPLPLKDSLARSGFFCHTGYSMHTVNICPNQFRVSHSGYIGNFAILQCMWPNLAAECTHYRGCKCITYLYSVAWWAPNWSPNDLIADIFLIKILKNTHLDALFGSTIWSHKQYLVVELFILCKNTSKN